MTITFIVRRRLEDFIRIRRDESKKSFKSIRINPFFVRELNRYIQTVLNTLVTDISNNRSEQKTPLAAEHCIPRFDNILSTFNIVTAPILIKYTNEPDDEAVNEPEQKQDPREDGDDQKDEDEQKVREQKEGYSSEEDEDQKEPEVVLRIMLSRIHECILENHPTIILHKCKSTRNNLLELLRDRVLLPILQKWLDDCIVLCVQQNKEKTAAKRLPVNIHTRRKSKRFQGLYLEIGILRAVAGGPEVWGTTVEECIDTCKTASRVAASRLPVQLGALVGDNVQE
jgi:hypothetical protein